MKKLKLYKKDYIYLSLIAILLAAVVTLSVFLSILSQKKEKDALAYYYDQKCSAFEMNNINASHSQIVFIGDSITDGYKLDDYYRELSLATYNRGIGGDTTGGVLARLDVSLFDIKPTKIVLMIGTNDINWGISKDEILNNYREILSKIKEALPDTEVFCMSVIPQNRIFVPFDAELAKRTETILEVNEGIKALVDSAGYSYVNIFDDLSDDAGILKNEYTDDGLHLNHEGYIVWTAVLKPLLG